MAVQIQFIKNDKETDIIQYQCFGILEERALKAKFKENRNIVRARGSKVCYIFKSKCSVEDTQKYLTMLRTTHLLDQITLEEPESLSFRAIASCELPGQEIVGKFEMLRHLELAPGYVQAVVKASTLLKVSYNIENNYLGCFMLVHLFNIPRTITAHDIFSTQKQWYYHSSNFLGINVEISRSITKSYRASYKFSGVWYYFLCIGTQSINLGRSIDSFSFKGYTKYYAELPCSLEQAIEFFKQARL